MIPIMINVYTSEFKTEPALPVATSFHPYTGWVNLHPLKVGKNQHLHLQAHFFLLQIKSIRALQLLCPC